MFNNIPGLDPLGASSPLFPAQCDKQTCPQMLPSVPGEQNSPHWEPPVSVWLECTCEAHRLVPGTELEQHNLDDDGGVFHNYYFIIIKMLIMITIFLAQSYEQ